MNGTSMLDAPLKTTLVEFASASGPLLLASGIEIVTN